jgi:hypothetical protein
MNATLSRNARRALLVRRFRSLRLGGAAALSLLTVRAIDAESSREAARIAASIAKGRERDRSVQDDTPIAEIGESHGLSLRGYTLTHADRATLAASLGRAPRALVVKSAPVVNDEPIDPGFIPAPVEPYAPIITHDPAIDAQAAIEAAAEVAEIEARDARDADALSFVSDLESGIVDYTPAIPTIATVAPVDNSEHAQLARLVLANVAIAREAAHVARRNGRTVAA